MTEPHNTLDALLKIAGWDKDGLEISLFHKDDINNIYAEHGINISFADGQIRVSNFFAGRRTFFQGGGMLSPNTIIGRYCSISINANVGSTRHNMEWLSTGRLPPSTAAQPPVAAPFTIVGHDVWIGAGATVIGGVKIGHGACIGAGSVVTRDVAPYAIVAGSPARLIRYRFPEEVVESLLTSKWWSLPEDVIGQMPYHDIEACLRFLRDYRRG